MSRSSWPLSMPMFRIQLKSTAFRSLASFAGVYGSGTPRGPCALAVRALIVRTAPIATGIQCRQMILRRVAMMVPRSCLIVRVTGGDLDHATVRHDNRLEKTQRTAIPCGKELHSNVVSGVEGIRSGFTDPPLREGGGGAECHHPRSRRAIRILDRDSQRPVGIYKLQAFDRPRQLH